jgi:hypothetical protein
VTVLKREREDRKKRRRNSLDGPVSDQFLIYHL